MSVEARQIGAVNTVTITPQGHTAGHNTDRSGFRRNFEEVLSRATIEDKTAVLIGAGGPAEPLPSHGWTSAPRPSSSTTPIRGRRRRLSMIARGTRGGSRARAARSLSEEIASAAGVVNGTPIGMTGFPSNPVPIDALEPRHWVADVIYTPAETQLVKAANSGARTLRRVACVHQAAEAIQLFTGLGADVQHMHRTIARALAERDRATRQNA